MPALREIGEPPVRLGYRERGLERRQRRRKLPPSRPPQKPAPARRERPGSGRTGRSERRDQLQRAETTLPPPAQPGTAQRKAYRKVPSPASHQRSPSCPDRTSRLLCPDDLL